MSTTLLARLQLVRWRLPLADFEFFDGLSYSPL
ncbi:hypothetical protein LINPERPRIM_LOCUS7098, partial [Linum perenne]